MKKRQKGS